MPQKRAILEHLTRDELGTIVEHHELQVADRRVREQLIDAVAGSRRAALADILPGYSRDRLKELCRALDLDDAGRETAPNDTTLARLEGIVRKKALWIVERRRRRDELTPLPLAREFVSGESFRYLGRQYRLKVERVAASKLDDDGPSLVRLLGGYLRVAVPASIQMHDHVRASLVAWYQAKAADFLPDKLATLAHRVGVAVPRLLVSDPPKRWGSASKTGIVRINWRAIQAPAALVEYILAHELLHLRHDDHSRAFWSALGRVMPDYDSRKDKLRALGPSLTW